MNKKKPDNRKAQPKSTLFLGNKLLFLLFSN